MMFKKQSVGVLLADHYDLHLCSGVGSILCYGADCVCRLVNALSHGAWRLHRLRHHRNTYCVSASERCLRAKIVQCND